MKTIIKDILIGSRNAFSRRILNKYPITPMMKQREIRIIEEVITKLKPNNVLEWGSGYSTLYYSQLINPKSKWLAIEHDIDWHKRILTNFHLAYNTQIKLIEPNDCMWSDKYNDGEFDDFQDYVLYPKTLKEKFDLILIDGRARRSCLKVAKKVLANNGVIIIHDANRTHYYDDLKFKKNQTLVFLDGGLHGGIFLYNKKDINRYLNISNHIPLWDRYKKITKIKFFGRIIQRIT